MNWRRRRKDITAGPLDEVSIPIAAPVGSELYVNWTCGGCLRQWRKYIGNMDLTENPSGRLHCDIACPICDSQENPATWGVERDLA